MPHHRTRSTAGLPMAAVTFYIVAFILTAYFAYSAIQGPSGTLRRIQLEAETVELIMERDRLLVEVGEITNLTRRLSDEYLDLDLLDERARTVLGMARADEVLIP